MQINQWNSSRLMTFNFAFLALAGFVLYTNAAFARSEGKLNPLQVSGGIAMPATSTSVLSNPAGLVGAPTALVMSAAAPSVWNNGTYRADVQTGGSSYGVAAGLEDQPFSNGNGGGSSGSNSLNAFYGLAVGTESFSFGLSGRTGILHSSGSSFNAGFLFGVGSTTHFGLTAIGIDGGVSEWGAGLAYGAASGVDLVLDAAANRNLSQLEIKPGIKVSGGEAALTLSYGSGPRQEFAGGFSAGASYQFASNKIFEFQYNAGGSLSKYYLGFTLGI